MADPVQPIVPGSAVSAASPAAPVVAQPLEPPAAAAPAPVVEPAPVVVPAAPVEAKPLLASDKPSLLEEFDRKAAEEAKAKEEATKAAAKPEEPAKPAEAKPEVKPEAKPAEVKPEAKPAEAKPVEAKPAEPVKPEPVAYTYELPPTITLDEPRRAEFHTALDGFRADPVKGAQGLISLHERAMTDYAAKLAQDQHDAFNKTRAEWNKQVLADPEIGGAGHQTAMKAIARMRDLLVPASEKPEFDQFMRITGAGDHPAFLKVLHRVAGIYDEPAPPNPDIKPPKDAGARPGGKRGRLYDHPSSSRGNGAS